MSGSQPEDTGSSPVGGIGSAFYIFVALLVSHWFLVCFGTSMMIVERALDLVPNDSRIGLGSGHAAQAFIQALGERIRNGRLRVQGVPTSEETANLAKQEGIPLLTLTEAYAV